MPCLQVILLEWNLQRASLKIHRLRTAKQQHGLHSALTTLCSFMGKPTAGAPINSTVLSHILEKNNFRRTGKRTNYRKAKSNTGHCTVPT